MLTSKLRNLLSVRPHDNMRHYIEDMDVPPFVRELLITKEPAFHCLAVPDYLVLPDSNTKNIISKKGSPLILSQYNTVGAMCESLDRVTAKKEILEYNPDIYGYVGVNEEDDHEMELADDFFNQLLPSELYYTYGRDFLSSNSYSFQLGRFEGVESRSLQVMDYTFSRLGVSPDTSSTYLHAIDCLMFLKALRFKDSTLPVFSNAPQAYKEKTNSIIKHIEAENIYFDPYLYEELLKTEGALLYSYPSYDRLEEIILSLFETKASFPYISFMFFNRDKKGTLILAPIKPSGYSDSYVHFEKVSSKFSKDLMHLTCFEVMEAYTRLVSVTSDMTTYKELGSFLEGLFDPSNLESRFNLVGNKPKNKPTKHETLEGHDNVYMLPFKRKD